MDLAQFEGRKKEHLEQAMNPANQSTGLGRLNAIHLIHEALPDLDFEEISLDSDCLGKRLPTPFYVAGMTAGHPDAAALNELLAAACQRRGWAMGVGSQRRELASDSVDNWKRLRERCPGLVLFGNLGISQIARARLDDVKRIVHGLGAQALAVHANAAQEAIQPEGTPQFKGSLQALRTLCEELGVPVLLKETGCGFSQRTLERVAGFGLAAVDVSGLGGTHWGRIEGARARAGSVHAQAAVTFADWGEPTVESVQSAARVFSGTETQVWASGGVRTGLDSAKLIALGADRVGYAQPALEAALGGAENLDRWMERQEYELKVALFCTGCRAPGELRSREGAWRPIPQA